MRDSMQDDTAARLTLATGLRTNGTVNGTAVDSVGTGNNFRSAMLLVIAGAVTDGTHTVTLQDSDDGTTFAAVAADQVQGTLAAVTAGGGATSGPNSVQRQSYLGSKRYLRASVTTASATTGGTTTAVILLAQGSGAPVT
jgi:hypothetical protein